MQQVTESKTRWTASRDLCVTLMRTTGEFHMPTTVGWRVVKAGEDFDLPLLSNGFYHVVEIMDEDESIRSYRPRAAVKGRDFF